MRRPRWMIWLLAGGVPLCILALVPALSRLGLAGADEALAQTAPSQTGAIQAETAFPMFQPRRPLMDYLRWQALSPQERAAQAQNEQEEWSHLVEFLKDNCPNRYLLLLRQSPKANSPLRLRLLVRWQNMLQLQRNQPELFDLHVQQFKQEDVLIGLAAQLRQARNRHEGVRIAELRDQIQEEAGKFVDLNLRQRALTIQHAQNLLNQEQASFQQDTLNKTDLSRKRSMQILQQVDRAYNSRDAVPTGDQ